MKRAVFLAARGYPAPNPRVGCVLVQDQVAVGEGWHPYAGGPHAEVVALMKAGGQARGATAYVTLEPCNHQGRTGPCSHALLQAGVARVVYAVDDPNPAAQGGAEFLRAAGVTVEAGCLADEAESANVAWLTAVRRGWPYVIAKAAMSLDGRIALPSGESQWITGLRARAAGHRLRVEAGCVLVGRRTVEQDNPHLTARIPGAINPPVRVAVDLSGRLPATARMFDEAAPSHRLVSKAARSQDLEVPNGEPATLLRALYDAGVRGVLVEGGADTLGRFIASGLVDRFELFVAPKVLGAGPAWASFSLSGLADAPNLRVDRIRRVGDDLWMTAFRA